MLRIRRIWNIGGWVFLFFIPSYQSVSWGAELYPEVNESMLFTLTG